LIFEILESLLCVSLNYYLGIKIANSIDVTQSKAKKQVSQSIHSLKTHSEIKKHLGVIKDFLEELGVNGQQFKTLFGRLPQGIALYKVIYNSKGLPIDFMLLESNKVYNKYHHFKNNVGNANNLNDSNPKIKKDNVDWIGVYDRVAHSCMPEQFENYSEHEDKWYQIYVYCPKKSFLITVFMDITHQKKQATHELEEQKESEQKLSFSEKKYRRLYETTQDGIMARDLQGKMIDCNQAYAKMLEYSKKELRNLTVQDLLPEKWHEQREEVVNKVLQTGRSIVFEREYKRKGGSVFPASVRTWQLTDEKGKIIGIWSIVRDITEQKDSQKNLEKYANVLKTIIEDRTKQLKDSERLVAIGQTAGMVGHDLRNPLQTVIGELYLAKKEVASLVENEVKNNLIESIQAIEEQAVYMDKIVSDLQAFVQPIRVDKKPFSLKELIGEVLTSVMVPNNIAVKMQIKSDFPQIKADLHLIKRVLINLVTNSVQAMPGGGTLTLTGRFSLQGQVFVTVKDTGVGIPNAIKNQIFTPLFTTKPRGQGFGLAVCKRVMEAHGGTISFESKAGKGAEFTIQFPTN
jgi:PAS domain S-box-containing protein